MNGFHSEAQTWRIEMQIEIQYMYLCIYRNKREECKTRWKLSSDILLKTLL